MYHVLYFVMLITTGDGVTSVSIPQANMKQCEINMQRFPRSKTFCLAGVK